MKIGNVTLDHDLIWEDEMKFTRGVGVAENTIYGGLVVQTFRTSGYKSLTLSGNADFGWQSRTTVLALQALANDYPGTVFAVELPDGLDEFGAQQYRTVYAMFRNEEPPVVEFTPITTATDPGSGFWYYGTVRMRIVE